TLYDKIKSDSFTNIREKDTFVTEYMGKFFITFNSMYKQYKDSLYTRYLDNLNNYIKRTYSLNHNELLKFLADDIRSIILLTKNIPRDQTNNNIHLNIIEER
ncbi:9703_t:CDS:1, partial [Scutellospora calospora]